MLIEPRRDAFRHVKTYKTAIAYAGVALIALQENSIGDTTCADILREVADYLDGIVEEIMKMPETPNKATIEGVKTDARGIPLHECPDADADTFLILDSYRNEQMRCSTRALAQEWIDTSWATKDREQDRNTAGEWTPAESTIATAEGWDLFDEGGTYGIERDDDANKFATDSGALAYVMGRAKEGSELHAKALGLIDKPCPYEHSKTRHQALEA